MTQYDVEKVRSNIAQAEADVAAQRKVVDKISDLLEYEERDLVALERLLQLRIEAWRAQGVDL